MARVTIMPPQMPTVNVDELALPVTLDYLSGEGERTRRLVTVHRAVGSQMPDGTIALDEIHGYCHLRKMARTFRIDRIREAVTDDGEVITDFAGWILTNAGDQTDAQGNDHQGVIAERSGQPSANQQVEPGGIIARRRYGLGHRIARVIGAIGTVAFGLLTAFAVGDVLATGNELSREVVPTLGIITAVFGVLAYVMRKRRSVTD